MRDDQDRRHRRSIRMPGYDYSQPGAYFVTIVTQGRECVFGEIVDGEMRLNASGRMVGRAWGDLPARFPFVGLDAFVVMPNHVHGVMVLTGGDGGLNGRGDPCDRPFRINRQCGQGEYPVVSGANGRIRPYVGDGNVRGRGRLGDAVDGSAEHGDRPHGTLVGTVGRVVQGFKSITTHEYTVGVKEQGWPRFPRRLWQRNYHEHVVRDEDDLQRLRQYIADNPQRWALDRENPSNVRKAR